MSPLKYILHVATSSTRLQRPPWLLPCRQVPCPTWPRFVMLKVLTQYAELTGPRVVPLLDKYVRYRLQERHRRPLREWDEVLSVIRRVRSPRNFRSLFASWLLIFLIFVTAAKCASGLRSGVILFPIPAEVRSAHFRVSLNGRSTEVMHAATGYYILNFDTTGPVTVAVTASDPHFWDAGVEVQPMRFGIRPVRRGATITFRIAGPIKLTVTRPGDHFADAEMLFLFANAPDLSGITPHTSGIRYYGPGAHRENIDAHSGDTIYLAGGRWCLAP